MLQRLLAASAAYIRLTCAYCCSPAPEPQQPLQDIGSDSNVQAEKPVPTVAGERPLGLLVYPFKLPCLVQLLDLALIAVVIAAGQQRIRP
jgi:hypothetical protein